MNMIHARDGENPTYQYSQKRPEGSQSVYVYSSKPMDQELELLFADFKLEDASAVIADSLGVRMVSDFHDVEEIHVASVCNSLNLKPVHETRLRRLVQWVKAKDDPYQQTPNRNDQASMYSSDNAGPLLRSQQGQVYFSENLSYDELFLMSQF
jgi:hypothetical protein